MRRATRTAPIAVAFVVSVALANYATTRYGGPDRVVPVGFGLQATAGTMFAGACLALRDALQDVGGRVAVLLAVAAGALISAWTSSPTLAVASGVAFAVSELADAAVYTPLRRHSHVGGRRWAAAVAVSGVVGAVADSVLFLWLARFPIVDQMPGQLLGKTWATLGFLALGTVAAWVVRRRRDALLLQPDLSAGA